MASPLFFIGYTFQKCHLLGVQFSEKRRHFLKILVLLNFILTKSRRCLISINFSNKTSKGTPISCYRFVSLNKFYIKYWFYRKTPINLNLYPLECGCVPNVLKLLNVFLIQRIQIVSSTGLFYHTIKSICNRTYVKIFLNF